MNESSIRNDTQWARGSAYADDAGIDALCHQAKDVAARSELYYAAGRYNSLDVDDWSQICSNVVRTSYFQEASPQRQSKIVSALDGRGHWVYVNTHMDDGLFPGTESVITRQADDVLSRLVLSGVLGDNMLRDDAQLAAIAESREADYHRRAVLVGGAALAELHKYGEQHLLPGYFGQHDFAELAWHTQTGGSIHGDFRSHRTLQHSSAISHSGEPEVLHLFAPAVESEGVAAYHGIEPRIALGLLYHLVVKEGNDPRDLHSKLLKQLFDKNIQAGGAFGDYGYSDGAVQAYGLRQLINDEQQLESVFEVIVDPAIEGYTYELISTQGGVKMVNKMNGNEKSALYIPSGEIPDYLTTMIANGGGRTAPQALVNVIDALIDRT